jgi:hypothetical protein
VAAILGTGTQDLDERQSGNAGLVTSSPCPLPDACPQAVDKRGRGCRWHRADIRDGNQLRRPIADQFGIRRSPAVELSHGNAVWQRAEAQTVAGAA